MGQHFGGRPGTHPVCESISDRLVRLPFYNGLSSDQQAEVIEAVRAFPG
jgi:dTDP-4-amino-4,6-dideoxygalactose transaminase